MLENRLAFKSDKPRNLDYGYGLEDDSRTICTTDYHSAFVHSGSLEVSLMVFFLNMVDYPRFFPLLSTMTWDTFLTLRVTLGHWLISETSTSTQTF